MGSVGAFLVIMLAFLLLVPSLINLEPIKKEILVSVSEKLGGEVKYHRVDLSLFPRPHAVIHHGQIILTGMINAKLKSLTVYLKILPLFQGRLQIVQLKAEGPVIDVRLPGMLGRRKRPCSSVVSLAME